ncbi:hypothetical protein GCM10009841_16130 [Microlunatus panaciterrae]|uniref:DUF3137 domain-containing protein n=1 Tax=Microlunatus panaciterrae TaxID=400768 RepID=A0ABS2RMD5_9ACTN|nr:hypothetical protein [Microlunatus panaciterrae]MBM7800171.1 hypothetical protein [Microlunatus panaciterrae]
MNSSTVLLILVLLVAAGVAVAVVFAVRRQLWKGKIRELGWRYESSPSLASAQSLGVPPFGVGISRKVDNAIVGRTRSGWAFQSLEYTYTGGGPAFDDRVAMVSLPLALPELYVCSRATTPRRTGVRWPEVTVDPAFGTVFGVRAAEPGYATAVLTPQARQQLVDWARTGPVDLSIDHRSLVALGAPKDPDELTVFVDRLAGVAAAMDLGRLGGYAIADKVPGYGFYGQDWAWVGVDDSLIPAFAGIDPFGVGTGRRTSDVIRGTVRGVPMTAFRYHWQTTHTETSTDSEGHTHTRTVTDHHQQPIIALSLPVQVPDLSVLPEGLLRRRRDIDFESQAFNEAFTVISASRKLAYDVIHPRMMEFLLAARPGRFCFHRNLLVAYPASHDTQLISQTTDFLTSFLGRIPEFVWRDLGATQPLSVPTPALGR